jgi:hypothetical protein
MIPRHSPTHTHTHAHTRTQTLERARTVSPAVPQEDALPSVAVAGGVLELIDAACHPKNLCRMEPTWHPWF